MTGFRSRKGYSREKEGLTNFLKLYTLISSKVYTLWTCRLLLNLFFFWLPTPAIIGSEEVIILTKFLFERAQKPLRYLTY